MSKKKDKKPKKGKGGSLPAYIDPDRAARKAVNARSAKQEADHARKTGGKVQAGSGSSWRAPEDVRGPLDDDDEGFLDQLKSYETGRITITDEEWAKSRKNAHIAGREPRWIIEFPASGTRLKLVEDDS